MNYENMDDATINDRVAHYLPYLSETDYGYVWNEESGCEWDGCNNPSDAWSIIHHNGICITSPIVGSNNQLWSASWNEDGGRWSSGDIKHGDENPLKAAMIVFLMMRDAEK